MNEKKIKYFINRYKHFCIVSGIAGFLMAPFLWPFFLAIIVNTISLSVPVLLVYFMVRQLRHKKQENQVYETEKMENTSKAERRKEEQQHTKTKPENRQAEKVVVNEGDNKTKPRQENMQTIKGADEEKVDEVTQAAISWYILEGRERFRHISGKLIKEGIDSFSVGKDGMCSIRTEEGFRRVAAIRDFPTKRIRTIQQQLEKDGEYRIKMNGRYMWVTRIRR